MTAIDPLSGDIQSRNLAFLQPPFQKLDKLVLQGGALLEIFGPPLRRP